MNPEVGRRLLPRWWEEWDGRLDAELARFDQLGLPHSVTEDPRAGGNRLVLESAAPSADGPVRVVVVFPDGYPHRRFQIYAPDIRLARHQAPSGDLCILARDAKYWSPAEMAADYVHAQVPKLLELVGAGGETLRDAEDPQGEPVTSYYGGTPFGGVVVDDHIHGIDFDEHDRGSMSFCLNGGGDRWMFPQDATRGEMATGQGLLVGLKDESGTVLADCSQELLRRRFGDVREGRWVYLADPPLTDSATGLWVAAVAADPTIESWVMSSPGLRLLGVCVREEVAQGVFGPAWVFLARQVGPAPASRALSRSGNPARRNSARRHVGEPSVVQALRWTDAALSTRIPELAPLRLKTVALIGLGSLGAPIFQELVKARVGTVRVLDGDHIDAGTSVRYPLGLAQAGLSKVLALHEWAYRHDPGVNVQARHFRLGTAPQDAVTSELDVLADLLDGVDLMVNATAEMDISRQLDRIAVHLEMARLHVWSQSGRGGVVALLRQGNTGCFHCLELALSKMSEEGRPAVAVPSGLESVQAPGCADLTFTATHPDLLPVAIQAASVAFGELSGDGGGYPPFDSDLFTVQTRSLDGKPLAPSWESFKLPPNPNCPMCQA